MIRTAGRFAMGMLAAALLSGSVQGARRQSESPRPQAPVFRSGVDLVAVDVSVVDGSGQPIKGLRADQFEVWLDGKPRRVVSAELLNFVTSLNAKSAAAPAVRPLFSSNEDSAGKAAVGRLIYLAVDQASFRTAGAQGAMEAARKFIDRLQP